MAAAQPVFRKPKPAPLSVVRMIWKRKYLAMAFWIPMGLLTAVIVYSLPAVYRAEAVILVESQRIPERFVTSTVNAELKDRLATLSQQIFSYKRFLEIVERFDLYHDERKTHVQEEIIEMMRSDVAIQVDDTWTTKSRSETRPSAFRISYQGTNPEVVALVTNQLANLFIDENLHSREVQATGTSEFLGSQLAEAKKRLEEQEARMSEFKQQHNGELPEQEVGLLARLGQLQAQWQAANDALARAEQSKHILQSAIASADLSEAAIAQLAEQLNDPDLSSPTGAAETLKSSDRLQRQLEQSRLVYTEDHPVIKALRALIPKLRHEEEAERDRLKNRQAPKGGPIETHAESGADEGASVPTVRVNRGTLPLTETLIRERERTRSLKAQEELADKQITTATADQARLAKEIGELQRCIAVIPAREQELAVLKRDYEVSRANYQSLMDKGLSANMAAEMELRQKAERFTVIDAARVPQKPVRPNRPLWYSLGGCFGLLFGLSVAMAFEYQTNTLLGEWELPKGVPVLARVPRIKPSPPSKVTSAEAERPKRRRWVWIALLILVVLATAAGAVVYFGWVQIPGIGFNHA
jgi:polysaccharide chain length determinant protein (PEP-CTERM system associated)